MNFADHSCFVFVCHKYTRKTGVADQKCFQTMFTFFQLHSFVCIDCNTIINNCSACYMDDSNMAICTVCNIGAFLTNNTCSDCSSDCYYVYLSTNQNQGMFSFAKFLQKLLQPIMDLRNGVTFLMKKKDCYL